MDRDGIWMIISSESSFTEIDGDDSEVENFPGTDNNNGDSSVTSSVGPHNGDDDLGDSELIDKESDPLGEFVLSGSGDGDLEKLVHSSQFRHR